MGLEYENAKLIYRTYKQTGRINQTPKGGRCLNTPKLSEMRRTVEA